MVTIVMSNLGLEQAMDNAGIKMVRTAVGDRYILERMLAEDYNFGGEQSGHIIFLHHNTTGGGLNSGPPAKAPIPPTDKAVSHQTPTITGERRETRSYSPQLQQEHRDASHDHTSNHAHTH